MYLINFVLWDLFQQFHKKKYTINYFFYIKFTQNYCKISEYFFTSNKFFPLIKTRYLYCDRELNCSRRGVSVFPVSARQFSPVSFSILPIFPPNSFIFEFWAPNERTLCPNKETTGPTFVQFWRIAQCADFPNLTKRYFIPFYIPRLYYFCRASFRAAYINFFMRKPARFIEFPYLLVSSVFMTKRHRDDLPLRFANTGENISEISYKGKKWARVRIAMGIERNTKEMPIRMTNSFVLLAHECMGIAVLWPYSSRLSYYIKLDRS